MTICELRKQFPHSDFYFFENGKELQKAPFYHSEIKDFEEINTDTVFVHM